MNTNTNTNLRTNTIHKHMLTGALSILLSSSLLSAPVVAETQVRLQSSNETAAFSEGYALSVEDWSAQTKSARGVTSGQFNHQSQARPQVWISDIGTLLYNDYDADGYHSGFSVTMDIDSEYGDTEVYAKIYIQPTSGTTALLHKTGRFGVYGSTIGDEYRIDTTLRNNYINDLYNVSIDIHDAWSDELLDTANARGFSNLRQLPLESDEYNQYNESQYDHDEDNQYAPASSDEDNQYNPEASADVATTEYAAAFNPLLLLALAGGMLARRRLR